MPDIAELMWNTLQSRIDAVKKQAEKPPLERAEIADNIPAYALVDAPLAAQGGLGQGTTYVTLAWINDGRKSGEGVGAGTGVLAVYDPTGNQWLRLTDYSAVVV